MAKFCLGNLTELPLDEIKGYSTTEEYTRYGTKRGVLLYLKNGRHVDFTEINIKNVTPLIDYLNARNVLAYGSETLSVWFLMKYKYDDYKSTSGNLR